MRERLRHPTEGRAGNAGGNRTAHKGYQAGNFVSCLKSLDQGTGAHRLEKLLLKGLERLVAAELRDKVFQTGGVGRSRKGRVHRNTRPATRLPQGTRNRQFS